MTFEEAITKSIRQYFAGQEPSSYRKEVSSRKGKRDKKYFDNMEVELGLKEAPEQKEEEKKAGKKRGEKYEGDA